MDIVFVKKIDEALELTLETVPVVVARPEGPAGAEVTARAEAEEFQPPTRALVARVGAGERASRTEKAPARYLLVTVEPARTDFF